MKLENGKKIFENGDMLTPKQVEIRFPQFKERTLQDWRSNYEDTGGEDKIGPRWHVFGLRIRRYLFSDIMRAINNLPWLDPPPPLMRDRLNKNKKKNKPDDHEQHYGTSTPTPESKITA